jgi:hypothetical protein
LNHLIRTDQNSIDSVLVLNEYYFAAGRIDLMVYFSEITDFILVFDDIIDRVEELAGWEVANAIRCVDPSPPVGTDPHALPAYTARFLGLLFSYASNGRRPQSAAGKRWRHHSQSPIKRNFRCIKTASPWTNICLPVRGWRKLITEPCSTQAPDGAACFFLPKKVCRFGFPVSGDAFRCSARRYDFSSHAGTASARPVSKGKVPCASALLCLPRPVRSRFSFER